jgi:hypothetical protein
MKFFIVDRSSLSLEFFKKIEKLENLIILDIFIDSCDEFYFSTKNLKNLK